MRRWGEMLSTMEINFVVENRFEGLNFTLKSVMTRAARHLSRTRCPGWGSSPPRKQGMEGQCQLESIRVSQDGEVTTPRAQGWQGSKLNDAVDPM